MVIRLCGVQFDLLSYDREKQKAGESVALGDKERTRTGLGDY